MILLLISYSINHTASDFDETLITIETRKTAMQGIWERVKRLSPYVELKEKVEYDKDLAATDAKEIVKLLEKHKIYGLKTVIYLRKVSLMLHQQSGLFQIILRNYTLLQKNQHLNSKMLYQMMI